MTTPGVAGASGAGELNRAARGGAITFVGAGTSAACGFAFSLLLARFLGAGGAGVVFQALALMTIGASVARWGMDTTAVWLVPRLRAEDPAALRPAVTHLLACGTAGSLVVVALWYVALRPWWPTDAGGGDVARVVDVLVVLLPAVVVTGVGLGCSRAFGRILAFNVVDNITVPVLRPVGLVLVHLFGGGVVAAGLAWGLPWLVGVVLVGWVLHGCLKGFGSLPRPARSERAALRRRIRAYATPRAFAQAMEQSIIWLDVLLVGVIAGAAAAGVYGAAARFVAAGVVVATALRIVVAPRFSALLAQARKDDVAQLYAVTARWILLFGAPIYLSLAVFAPTVLGWLGDGFASGRSAMVVLCLGSVVVLAAGNVQALLLMSGRSGLGAVNKAVVLVVNVVGNVALVPLWGIEAAAAVWAVSMLLDTVLASVQVRRATGIALAWGSVLRVGSGVLVLVGGPMVAVATGLGQGNGHLVLAIALGAVGLGVYCLLDRRLLHLTDLLGMVRR